MVHSIPIGRWLTPGNRQAAGTAACTAAILAALSTAPLTAQAQPAARPEPRAAKPDPLDPKASIPTLSYQSSFTQYRRLDESKPISWREANDTVTRIGGWRVYAREAQQPDPAPAAKPTDSSPAAKPAVPAPAALPNETAKPMPAGHGGHKTP